MFVQQEGQATADNQAALTKSNVWPVKKASQTIAIRVKQRQSVSDQAALRGRKEQGEVQPTSSHTLPVQGLNQTHRETWFGGDNITLPSIRPMK